MEIVKSRRTSDKILLILLKNLVVTHTASSLSKDLNMSRWGVWKILNNLKKEELIIVESVGVGKTGTQRIRLNWDNILVTKILALLLAQEASKYKRWQSNFSYLEREVEFLILYGSILHSPKEAKDIDIIMVCETKKLREIGNIILKIQQTQAKKIHSINFTWNEFKQELKKPNKVFLDAVKKGVILFGYENFVGFIRELET